MPKFLLCLLKPKSQNLISNKGFTLIELLIVLSIIGVIFGVIATYTAAVRKNSRDATRQSDLRAIQSALQHYYADANYFPPFTTLPSGAPIKSADNSKTYLTKTPVDPSTGSVYGYEPLGTGCSTSTPSACTDYCLYALLENTPSTPVTYSKCNIGGSFSSYNYQLIQP